MQVICHNAGVLQTEDFLHFVISINKTGKIACPECLQLDVDLLLDINIIIIF